MSLWVRFIGGLLERFGEVVYKFSEKIGAK